jgi:phospholipid-binding lipoprotein MlaA
MFLMSATSSAWTLSAQAPSARRMLAIPALAMTLVMAACATAPNQDPHDPFQPYNRGMDTVNRDLDHAVLRPVATAYQKTVPDPVRTVVSNVFGNISDVWSAVNSALQLKLGNAGENAGRFVINTTMGFGGMFDIAERMNLERHREDFGRTLGRWGVPPGPYVVLPLLGPSSVRDALALPLDFIGDPLLWVSPPFDAFALATGRAVDRREDALALDPVLDEALDPYLFLRDAYIQRRQSQAGRTGSAPLRPPEDAGAADASDKSGEPTETGTAPPSATPNEAG